MDWQSIITGLIILAAAAHVLRSGWRLLKSKGCGSGCGKCATTETRLIELQIRK